MSFDKKNQIWKKKTFSFLVGAGCVCVCVGGGGGGSVVEKGACSVGK